MKTLRNISSAQAVSVGIVLLLVSCSVENLNGNAPVADPKPEQPAAILIEGHSANAAAPTRASGSAAADLLGGSFRVFATNDGGMVFDNYVVNWTGSPTASITNRVGWEYNGYMSKAVPPALQTVKYWDESRDRYDFVAFSGLSDAQIITSVDANTFAVSAANMYDLYYANRVSAMYAHMAPVPGISPEFIEYRSNVKFSFRRATSRIRVGFYEIINGYAVKDLRFYYGDNATAAMGTSAKSQAGVDGCFPEDGEYTITYDADNAAHAAFNTTTGSTVSNRNLGNLDLTYANCTKLGIPYIDADGTPTDEPVNAFIGSSSATVSYALSTETIDGVVTDNCPWHVILPFEENTTPLRLRVDYTLVALDGTGDKIRVRGAEAIVPVEYCCWKPNYSYTYIFKINSSSGHTSDTSPEGLYPITFDAEVSDVRDDVTEYIDMQ